MVNTKSRSPIFFSLLFLTHYTFPPYNQKEANLLDINFFYIKTIYIILLIKSKTSSKKIDDASSHDHMIIYHVQSFTEVLKELQTFATKKNRKQKTENLSQFVILEID